MAFPVTDAAETSRIPCLALHAQHRAPLLCLRATTHAVPGTLPTPPSKTQLKPFPEAFHCRGGTAPLTVLCLSVTLQALGAPGMSAGTPRSLSLLSIAHLPRAGWDGYVTTSESSTELTPVCPNLS